MEKKPFTVLKEDLASSTEFTDVKNCPGMRAFKRQFPDIDYKYIEFGVNTFYQVLGGNKKFAYLDKRFGIDAYDELREGIEFHTEITFN